MTFGKPQSPSASSSSNKDVVQAVSFYLVTSITMVLANKWVLKFLPDLPLLVLWLQIVVAVVLIIATQYLGLLSFSPSKLHRIPRLSLEKARKLWPLIAINVVGLSFNTYCLVYVNASMYQVARSLILPLTVLLQYFILNVKSSMGIVGSCAIVCTGFLVGLFMDDPAVSETSAHGGSSLIGVVFGVLSSITTALHSIIIKSSLDAVDGDTLELVWYNNALSALALLPILLISGEFSRLSIWLEVNSTHLYSYGTNVLVLGTLLTGIFGFLINLAGFFQIKITSPVTHMISSAVRGVLQTILAVWLFDDLMTSSRISGIFLILLGSSVYTWQKANQNTPISYVSLTQNNNKQPPV